MGGAPHIVLIFLRPQFHGTKNRTLDAPLIP